MMVTWRDLDERAGSRADLEAAWSRALADGLGDELDGIADVELDHERVTFAAAGIRWRAWLSPSGHLVIEEQDI